MRVYQTSHFQSELIPQQDNEQFSLKIQNLTSQLENSQNQEIALKHKIEEKDQNYANLQEENDILKQKNIDLQNFNLVYKEAGKKSNEQLFNGYVDLKKQFNEQQRYIDILENLLNQNSSFGTNILKSAKEMMQNNVQQKKIAHKIDHLNDKGDEQGYDMRISFTSVKQLITEGANIILKFSENSPEYKRALSQEVSLVSFLGLKNAGKSYWHSKLTQQFVYQGYLSTTKGLNCNFKDKFWFMDSPGLGETLQNFSFVQELRDQHNSLVHEIDHLIKEKPEGWQKKSDELLEQKKILYEDIKKQSKEVFLNQNELYKEKIALENFIQSFILENAQFIVYVSDILNLEEQRYITQISQKIRRNGKSQKLIVFHNLKNIDDVSKFQQHIKKDINNNFPLDINSSVDQKSHIYKDFDFYDSETIHLVFGKEGSEVAKVYNQKSEEEFWSILKLHPKKLQQKDLLSSFQQYVDLNLREYIKQSELRYLKNENDSESSNDQSYLQQIKQNSNGKNQQKNGEVICIDEPKFEFDSVQKKIYSKKLKNIDPNSILCKEIMTDYIGQRVNDAEQNDQCYRYEVYNKKIEEGFHEKIIFLSVPCPSNVEKLKKKFISDTKTDSKILNLSVVYKQEFFKFLETCKVEENDIDIEYPNNSPLNLKNIKIQIPLCRISKQFSQYKCEYLESHNLFKISCNINDNDFYDDSD